VWTGLAEIRRERGFMVVVWVCRSCQHQWTVKSEHRIPVKASAASRPLVAVATERKLDCASLGSSSGGFGVNLRPGKPF
jgi:hypothetical protein